MHFVGLYCVLYYNAQRKKKHKIPFIVSSALVFNFYFPLCLSLLPLRFFITFTFTFYLCRLHFLRSTVEVDAICYACIVDWSTVSADTCFWWFSGNEWMKWRGSGLVLHSWMYPFGTPAILRARLLRHGVLITNGLLNFEFESLELPSFHSHGSLVTWNHFQKRFDTRGYKS